MYRQADHVFDGRDAAEIDDRHDLLGHIRKAMPAPRKQFRRPFEFTGKIRGEKRFNGGAALGRPQVAASR